MSTLRKKSEIDARLEFLRRLQQMKEPVRVYMESDNILVRLHLKIKKSDQIYAMLSFFSHKLQAIIRKTVNFTFKFCQRLLTRIEEGISITVCATFRINLILLLKFNIIE